MNIILIGSKNRGCEAVNALLKAGFNLTLVVTHPDSNIPKWTKSIKNVATKNGLEVYQPEDINSTASVEKISSHNPDIIVLAGFDKLVSQNVIDIANREFINLHAGYIPEYRGAAPINWAIINGESKIGLSILRVDLGVDTGDIIGESTLSINAIDSYGKIYLQVDLMFGQLLVETIMTILNNTISVRTQTKNDGNFYSKRYPEDGLLNFSSKTAIETHNFIRALSSPMPGAFCYFKGDTIILESSKLIERSYKGVPGRIAASWRSGKVVLCKDKGLLITKARRGDEVVDANIVLPNTGKTLSWI